MCLITWKKPFVDVGKMGFENHVNANSNRENNRKIKLLGSWVVIGENFQCLQVIGCCFKTPVRERSAGRHLGLPLLRRSDSFSFVTLLKVRQCLLTWFCFSKMLSLLFSLSELCGTYIWVPVFVQVKLVVSSHLHPEASFQIN